MAHRLPIVATRSSPFDPELDHDWLTWVTPRHPSELAAALLTLLADPTLRQQRGDAAYRFSRAFDWQTIADRHLALYQTVLNPIADMGTEES
jgi:glycosyltransferase involved in cell wall biosynthesis